MNYTDPRSLDQSTYQYLAVTPEQKYVYGTMAEIKQAGATLTNYESGEAAGNNWDSLSQPRN
jgi:hypothetical protein